MSRFAALRSTAKLRFLSPALASVALAVAVTACGSSGGSGSNSHSLTIWNGDARPGAVAFLKTFTNAYHKSHPNVNIKIDEVASPDLDTKLRAAEKGGGTPDLVYTFRGNIYDWAADGLTVPVDDVYSASDKANLVPGILAPGTYKGKVYYVPSIELQQVIAYRKDWFKKAGLKPPHSWADVLHDAQVLNQPPHRYGFLTYDKPPEEIFATDLMTAYGANIFGADGKVSINGPKTWSALKLAAQLAKYSPPGSVSKDQSDMKDSFGQGLGAMMMSSTSTLGNAVDDGIGRDVGVVPIPTVGTSGTPTEAYGFSLTSKAQNVSGAKGLLREMLNPAVYQQASTKLVPGMIPILKSDLKPHSKFWSSAPIRGQQANLRVASNAAKDGVIGAQRNGISPYYTAIRAAGTLNTMISSALAGSSPQAAAAKAAHDISQLVQLHGG